MSVKLVEVPDEGHGWDGQGERETTRETLEVPGRAFEEVMHAEPLGVRGHSQP